MTGRTEGYQTGREVAAELGINAAALYARLKNHPELRPARRIGRAWAWTLEEVERIKQWEKETKGVHPCRICGKRFPKVVWCSAGKSSRSGCIVCAGKALGFRVTPLDYGFSVDDKAKKQ